MMPPQDPSNRPAALVVCLVTAAALLAAALPASGQYFGRNKVTWESHDFHVLESRSFDIYYYPEEHPLLPETARMAERWEQRLTRAFDHRLSERKPIIFYNDKPDFQQTSVTTGFIGEGTGGFTEPRLNRVVMPFAGLAADTDHVLGHELVHAFQFDIAEELARQRDPGAGTGAGAEASARVGLNRLPLWMVEGLAEYFSQGSDDPQTAMWLRDAVYHDRLPDFEDMARDPRFSPYQFGQAFYAYVAGRWDDQTVARLYVMANLRPVPQAFEEILGESVEQVFADWHRTAREDYRPVLDVRRDPTAFARPALTPEITRSDLNIAPALSPDGRWVAFLSTRDLFSIDLYLANARTGEVMRRLVSAAGNPHFDALRFLDSAGAWSPDSQQLAFVVFAQGDNQLAIVDVGSGDVTRRIPVEGVSAISSPTWSPDGRTLAFSGWDRGQTDLYLLDLETREVTRLTDDVYGDLQPTFSPDGETLAFVSDRGLGTDLDETLQYRPVRLSFFHLPSEEIRTLEIFPRARHSNPQFSPDGGSVYFIADPDGVADLFRLDLETLDNHRLTEVRTGVTGITELSPALSVAARTGEVMFSVLEDGDYSIYQLTRTAAPPLAEAAPDRRAAILPPIAAAAFAVDPAVPVEDPSDTDAVADVAAQAEDDDGEAGDQPVEGRVATRARPLGEDTVEVYLDNPTLGLPAPGEATGGTAAYDPRLRLEFVGPPVVGVGVDRYGLGAGGAISAYFGDLLGRHRVGVALQGGYSTSDDFDTLLGGQAFYLNTADRLQWGGSFAHIPYVSAQTRVGQTTVDPGDGSQIPAQVVQQLRETIVIDELSALAQYPLSLNRRIEGSVGYARYDFERELEEVIVVGGQVIDRGTRDLGAPEALDLYQASLAFVGDTSFFGFVSPIRGQRYRIEAEGAFGDLEYQTALADYRRYFFHRNGTFAVRALHYGRYGSDAESDRLSPLFLGRETLIRGYDVGSFDLNECTSVADSTACPEFDRLVGSRLAVLNLELRVPLLGVEEYGLFEAPFLPTDLVVFADGGTAWNSDVSPELSFDEDTLERVPVFSVGIATRSLIGGFLPVQLYYAVPLQRPEEDGVFGFVIAPGW